MTDIPLPAARVLHAWLIDHPGATYREAADGIGVTVSMIGRLLAGLEYPGWYTCEDEGRLWVDSASVDTGREF